jgi:acyl carrier protein
MRLDHFIMYSSATTLIGNPGQSAYVAANAYLEGLARRRRRAGLPGLAVAWGAIEDVGVLARSTATRDALANKVGIKGMQAQDALRLMNEVLSVPSTRVEDAVVAIAPINWSSARQHLAILKAPAYRRLASQDETTASDLDKIDIAALIAKSSLDEARKTIAGMIVEEIARVLRLPREDVARTTPLSEIGLDSLMAVELALGLEERFTLNAPLSTTASSFTVNELADHVIGLATGSLSEDEAITRTMVERHLGAQAAADLGEHVELLAAKSQTIKGLLH